LSRNTLTATANASIFDFSLASSLIDKKKSAYKIDHRLLLNDVLKHGSLRTLQTSPVRRDVKPDLLGKITRRGDNVRPHLPSILIPSIIPLRYRKHIKPQGYRSPFVGRRCSERDDQTEDGTQHSQQAISNYQFDFSLVRHQYDHFREN